MGDNGELLGWRWFQPAAKLYGTFLAFNRDHSASVAVFTGDKGVFCAGLDLKVAAKGSEQQSLAALAFPEHDDGRPLGGHGACGLSFQDRIEIVLFKGRSLEAKRELYRAMVQNLRPFDVPPEDDKVVLVETTPQTVPLRFLYILVSLQRIWPG